MPEDDCRLVTGVEMERLNTRLEIAERDIGTLRDKIARLAEREGCDDRHNHMPGLNRSQQ